jgi:hypothetical protein
LRARSIRTQANRAGAQPATETPYSVPRRLDVPDLPTMARGALNILDRNPNGLYLMIEGGAVDRAEHADDLGRDDRGEDRVRRHCGGASRLSRRQHQRQQLVEHLVIVAPTTIILLLGPDSDTVPFQDLKDNGRASARLQMAEQRPQQPARADIRARAECQSPHGCAKRNDAYTDAQGRRFGRGAYHGPDGDFFGDDRRWLPLIHAGARRIRKWARTARER